MPVIVEIEKDTLGLDYAVLRKQLKFINQKFFN